MQSDISTPSIPKSEYIDRGIDRLFIWLFSRKMARAIGAETKLSGYEGLVDLSKQIMYGRNAEQQQLLVAKILQSIVPAPVLWGIRKFFSPTRWVCVLNAWFAAQMFEWLVGSCKVIDVNVDLPDGSVRSQPSGVKIEKCRYLADSGCVGMCVNMCKVPTQIFFTEKFGIPLTMTPDFTDLSCEMVFGQIPPAPAADPAFAAPCLQAQCPTASAIAKVCPQL